MVPTTRYACRGAVHIAYQVVGGAGGDLVHLPGTWSHLEHFWREPLYARFLERLASICLGDDIGRISVHIGARVAADARTGEVLVSRTVQDLVTGSGISFTDRGRQALKGLPDEWRLIAVE